MAFSSREEVVDMFSQISSTYDLLNRILSLGWDKKWRKKGLEVLGVDSSSSLLDVACGSGDMLYLAYKKYQVKRLVGIDPSWEMLKICRKKVPSSYLIQGFAEDLPFSSRSFSHCTVAFGIRNFASPSKFIKEVFRILQKEGKFLIIEVHKTKETPKGIQLLFRYLVPLIGGLISRSFSAYSYLSSSAEEFYSPQELISLVQERGFQVLFVKPMFFRLIWIYVFKKRS